MILQKHHGEVEDCIIFGLSAITGHAVSYFMLLWKMVQSFIDYLSQHLFNVDLKLRMYLNVDLMSFSSGIVLVIILLFILGIS